MISHEYSNPLSPQERLNDAKNAFRSSLLQNDTIFSLLRARLSEPDSANLGLPDFGLEPTLLRNDDGTSIIGLRINHSATTEVSVVSLRTSMHQYLPLGRMNRTTGDTKVTPELEAALVAIGKEKADALDVWQAWQSSLNEMGAQFSEPLTLDPSTDTFELETGLIARNYVLDTE